MLAVVGKFIYDEYGDGLGLDSSDMFYFVFDTDDSTVECVRRDDLIHYIYNLGIKFANAKVGLPKDCEGTESDLHKYARLGIGNLESCYRKIVDVLSPVEFRELSNKFTDITRSVEGDKHNNELGSASKYSDLIFSTLDKESVDIHTGKTCVRIIEVGSCGDYIEYIYKFNGNDFVFLAEVLNEQE